VGIVDKDEQLQDDDAEAVYHPHQHFDLAVVSASCDQVELEE